MQWRYKKILSLVIFITPLLSCARYQRVIEPRGRGAFFSIVNSAELAVVQFYQSNDTRCRDQQHRRIKNMLYQRLQAVSKNQRFAYAQIVFILMDINTCPALKNDLSIAHLPTLLLFEQGQPHRAVLAGVANEIEINRFIDNNLGATINAITNERSDHDRAVEEAKMAAWASWGPYWYGGYYRPCYSNWGWGCGWGFNGCW